MAEKLFRREKYAKDMAEQLLEPTALQTRVRSGVFLSNIRRVGKTTFLRNELVPELRERGAVVIYVDLWSDTNKSPSSLVLDAVRLALKQLQVPGSLIGRRLKALNFGVAGVSFGFQIEAVGEPNGVTLAEAFKELVDKTATDVVLIVDEVQQALTPDGSALMSALKAARDQINSDRDTKGHFLFVGTGSHRSLVNDMANKPSHPFKGALTSTFESLPKQFVAWKLDQIRADSGRARLPSLESAWQGFEALGHRPEDLERALVQFQLARQGTDDEFDLICSTLAAASADVELARADEVAGMLGAIVFESVAAGPDEGTKDLYKGTALKAYADQIGSPVEAKQVQNAIDALTSSNLIARVGFGKFVVSDPFVRKVWRARREVTGALGRGTAAAGDSELT